MRVKLDSCMPSQTSLFDWINESPAINTPEPSILIHENSSNITGSTERPVSILSVKSSGLFYNRDAFPQDTTEQAALRVYEIIRPKNTNFGAVLDLNLRFNAYNEFPERYFRVNKSGVEHNYDVDTWHWWMLEHLDKIVKSMPS